MVIALVPARGGSTRIPGKNTRILNGHPLIAYAIAGAKHSTIFDGVYVSTESDDIAAIAKVYGADVIKRPKDYARSDSPDIEFVEHAIGTIGIGEWDTFIILRPTNPFRTVNTIKRAWREWAWGQQADSMRAVDICKQHPYKMWQSDGSKLIYALSDKRINGYRVHDIATQSLPLFLVQNGCVHISKVQTVRRFGDYTGERVLPFYTDLDEGFDLNQEEDWILAEALINRGIAQTEPIA